MADVVDLIEKSRETDRLNDLITAFSSGDRTINFGKGDYYIESGFLVPSDCALKISGKDNITVNGPEACVLLR